MTTNIEQEKIDFEAWNTYGLAVFKQTAWNAWQAALKLERERQASGEAYAWQYESPDKTWTSITSDPKELQDHLDVGCTLVRELFTAPQQSPIFTNGDRLMNMQGRNFTHEGKGYIQDNNFDFDAGLQVSGDFTDGEKEAYAVMIANALNTAPQQANILERLQIHEIVMSIEECPPIFDSDSYLVKVVKNMAYMIQERTINQALLESHKRLEEALGEAISGIEFVSIKLKTNTDFVDALKEALAAIPASVKELK